MAGRVVQGDSLEAARTYIKSEFALHEKDFMKQGRANSTRFWERNCVAGYKLFTSHDNPVSYDDSLLLQIGGQFVARNLGRQVQLVDIKKVEGGFGVLVYSTYKVQLQIGSATRNQIEQQYWIKTRKGYGLRAAQVYYTHDVSKKWDVFSGDEIVPEHLWRGPQIAVPPSLIQKVKAAR